MATSERKKIHRHLESGECSWLIQTATEGEKVVLHFDHLGDAQDFPSERLLGRACNRFDNDSGIFIYDSAEKSNETLIFRICENFPPTLISSGSSLFLDQRPGYTKILIDRLFGNMQEQSGFVATYYSTTSSKNQNQK